MRYKLKWRTNLSKWQPWRIESLSNLRGGSLKTLNPKFFETRLLMDDKVFKIFWPNTSISRLLYSLPSSIPDVLGEPLFLTIGSCRPQFQSIVHHQCYVHTEGILLLIARGGGTSKAALPPNSGPSSILRWRGSMRLIWSWAARSHPKVSTFTLFCSDTQNLRSYLQRSPN